MTPVVFTFLQLDGTPVANEPFTVTLRKASFATDEEGLVLPDTVELMTDADGKATVSLFPARQPYYVQIRDAQNTGEECSSIRYRILVPDTDEAVEANDILVTDPFKSTAWDEETIQIIVNARITAVDAAERAEASESAAAQYAAQTAMDASQTAQDVVTSTNAASTAVIAANSATVSAAEALASAKEAAELLETGNLPNIPDDNISFAAEGGETVYWDPHTAMGVTAGYDRGANVTIFSKESAVGSTSAAWCKVENPEGDSDFIQFVKVACPDGTVMWSLDNTTPSWNNHSIWFGSADMTNNPAPGRISIRGYYQGAITHGVTAKTYSYTNEYIEAALHYCNKNKTITLWIKEDHKWVFACRAQSDRIAPTRMGLVMLESIPAGSQAIIQHQMICYPNTVVFGDSISIGYPLYYPPFVIDGPTDSNAIWATHAGLYPMLRNNLPVLKGTGGWTSQNYFDNITDVTQTRARVVFFHASSNDPSNGVPQAARTQLTQACIDAMNAKGQNVVLLNSLPATQTHPDNGTGMVRDYCHSWWANHRHELRGVGQMLDAARVVSLPDGYQNPAITLPDGIHLTVEGVTILGERFRWFYSQGSSQTNQFQPLNSNLQAFSQISWEEDQVLIGNAVGGFDPLTTGAAGRTLLGMANSAEVKNFLSLSNVNNTSDADKPISTATQAALNGKQPTSAMLDALSATVGVANAVPIFTGPADISQIATGTKGRQLLETVDEAAARTTLGLGTAATVNTQSNTADATANRLMLVGAFGLGGINALNASDLNSSLPSGRYFSAADAIGKPAGEAYGYVDVFNLSSNYTMQRFTRFGSYTEFVRFKRDTWEDWINVTPLGHAQAWTSLVASRALNTTYTNSTGRAITLNILVTNSSAAFVALTLTVNGVIQAYSSYSYAAGVNMAVTGIVVPPGATYSAAVVNGTANLYNWQELR